MASDIRTPATHDELVALSHRLLLWACMLAVPAIALGFAVSQTWTAIARLGGASFMFAAGGFGLALIVLPLGAIICFVVALFLRVESVLRAPAAGRPGLTDRLCIAGAVLSSLLPAAWPASKALRALVTGSITIRQPIEHSFTAASDALVYWENVSYWLLATVALGGLAIYFWRSRWLRYRESRSSAQQAL